MLCALSAAYTFLPLFKVSNFIKSNEAVVTAFAKFYC